MLSDEAGEGRLVIRCPQRGRAHVLTQPWTSPRPAYSDPAALALDIAEC
jgi:hypothetical protein